jgi:hypothetical protein
MVAKVTGNRGGTNYGGAGGVGQRSTPDGSIGWVCVSGSAAGDTAYLRAVDVTSLDKVFQGWFFQANGTPTPSVTVYFTCAEGAWAVNPDPAVQAMVPWSNALALTTTTITKGPVAFSAIKVVFTDPGELYVVAR